ncbi:MAG: UDP-N-acetylenolpyruvoylglucosamine reductase [Stutzerimonas stutzeri]|nr:MAG: UDP-N-acetylenolpyruvoylglucosamine reductase [Stutzerimonas stutzeri]
MRGRRFAGLKFKRQMAIGPFIADFCCFEGRLIVELDGEPHETDEARERDRRRDAFLRSEGYQVLRFSNERVLGNLEFVLREIAEHVGLAGRPSSDPASPGHLLPEGRRRRAGKLMPFQDITPDIRAAAPELRGRLLANQEMAGLTWFRVGGPAQILFTPADEADLAYLLGKLPAEIPVTVVGLGSNLIVRDGGIPGVVIRLAGKAFGEIAREDGDRLRAGTAVPDVKVARAAADASLDGLAFYRGIPGCIGGALRMNAGAHGGETTDVLVEARGVTRKGEIVTLSHADMGFSYRNATAPADIIFTSALFQGRPGDQAAILAEMDRVTSAREAAQPIKERTGGSTFKNPEGGKAWELIDAAGCRGLRVGGAQVSEMHCNFLINTGGATAADIEGLGEEVRRRVKDNSGYELHWEIKRFGVAA